MCCSENRDLARFKSWASKVLATLFTEALLNTLFPRRVLEESVSLALLNNFVDFLIFLFLDNSWGNEEAAFSVGSIEVEAVGISNIDVAVLSSSGFPSVSLFIIIPWKGHLTLSRRGHRKPVSSGKRQLLVTGSNSPPLKKKKNYCR